MTTDFEQSLVRAGTCAGPSTVCPDQPCPNTDAPNRNGSRSWPPWA